MILRTVFLVISLLLFSNSLAGEITLNWIAPTQCTDGTPIASCPLSGYELEQSTSMSGPWQRISVPVPTTTAHTVTVPPGTYFWRVYALSGTVRSPPSNVVSKSVVTVPPAAPTGLTVKQNLTAYRLMSGNANKLYFSAVGKLPAGTKCTNIRVLDKQMIADRNKAIITAGLARPLQIYGTCS